MQHQTGLRLTMRWSMSGLLALAVWAGVASAQTNSTCSGTDGTIYDYTLIDLEGEEFSLQQYAGKVTVIFNAATY